jgi:hypothetical protein
VSAHAVTEEILRGGEYTFAALVAIVVIPWRKLRRRAAKPGDVDQFLDRLYAPCPRCPCHAVNVCEHQCWDQFPRPPSAQPCPCQDEAAG